MVIVSILKSISPLEGVHVGYSPALGYVYGPVDFQVSVLTSGIEEGKKYSQFLREESEFYFITCFDCLFFSCIILAIEMG